MNKTNLKWKLYESININKRVFITFHIFPCFSSRILTDTSQVPTFQLDYVVHFLSKAFPLIRPFISAFKISSHWLHTSDFALFFCCSRSMWQHWQVHFTDLIKLLVSSIVDGSKLFFFLFCIWSTIIFLDTIDFSLRLTLEILLLVLKPLSTLACLWLMNRTSVRIDFNSFGIFRVDFWKNKSSNSDSL